jgi:benzaldehyde dehydrogenase (NAD)
VTFLDGHSWHGRILFYRPTVLADAGPSIPAYEQEVFGAGTTVTPLGADDDASDSA